MAILTQSTFKKILLVILVIGFSNQGKAIDFYNGSYEQAIEKSKIENKDILLYFTAKWCGPCLMMEKRVFQVDTVQKATHDVIVLKVDIDSWWGEKLAKKYAIAPIPAFIVINHLQTIKRRHVGYLTASKFAHFVKGEQIDTKEMLQTYQKIYEQKQQDRSQWITEIGLQAGPNLMQLPTDAKGYRIGYSAGVFLSFTKKRLQLRPGINLSSKGGSLPSDEKLSITYLEAAAQISYTIIRRAFLHLPGGIRIHAAPYGALTLQGKENERQINKWDYGAKFGLSSFIGETSNLEVGLGYNLGISNITKTANSNLTTRGYYLSCGFIF